MRCPFDFYSHRKLSQKRKRKEERNVNLIYTLGIWLNWIDGRPTGTALNALRLRLHCSQQHLARMQFSFFSIESATCNLARENILFVRKIPWGPRRDGRVELSEWTLDKIDQIAWIIHTSFSGGFKRNKNERRWSGGGASGSLFWLQRRLHMFDGLFMSNFDVAWFVCDVDRETLNSLSTFRFVVYWESHDLRPENKKIKKTVQRIPCYQPPIVRNYPSAFASVNICVSAAEQTKHGRVSTPHRPNCTGRNMSYCPSKSAPTVK